MVAACSSESALATRVFDPCTPPRFDAPAATEEQRATIGDALALWRDAGLALGSPNDDAIVIAFERGAPALYGLYDGDAATIFINVELDSGDAAIALAHELGHVFGLVHVPAEERASVMNAGNLTIPPTSIDHSSVEAIWGRCAD